MNVEPAISHSPQTILQDLYPCYLKYVTVMASSDAGRPNKNPNPTIVQLEKPEKLKDLMRSEVDNCLSCKLVGMCYVLINLFSR